MDLAFIHTSFGIKPVLLLCFLSSFLLPKTVVDDQLWGSVEVNTSISSLLDLELEQQIRYKNHYSMMDKVLTNLSLSYQFHPVLEISGQFRYVIEDDNTKTRYGLSLKINPDMNDFIPRYKLKLQQEYDEDQLPEDVVLRNKITFNLPVRYNFKPSIYYESYHTDESEGFVFDKYRLSAGIEYEIGKNQSIELFYIYKGEIKKSDIEVTNITGLKYEYSF